MKDPTPLQALQAAILNGRYDDRLDLVSKKIYQSLANRRVALSTEALSSLVEGEKVRLKRGNYKPRYFQGLTGTIESLEGQVVWVRLDKPVVRKTKTVGKVGVQAIYVEAIE